jgi:hypothetical protein
MADRLFCALFSLVALSMIGVPRVAEATVLGFTADIGIRISILDPVVISGSGTGVLNGSGGGGHLDMLSLPASFAAGSAFVTVTDPAASPLSAVIAGATNGAGTFSGPAGSTSGVFGGVLPLGGSSVICLYTPACNFVNITVPFTVAGTRGVGIGSAPIAVTGAIGVTVTGAPWTIGTASAMAATVSSVGSTQTAMGFAHGPLSGGLSSAAATGGVVSLVTPIQIQTSIASFAQVPAFATLTLTFVPEPATALLLGASLVALAAARHRLR